MQCWTAPDGRHDARFELNLGLGRGSRDAHRTRSRGVVHTPGLFSLPSCPGYITAESTHSDHEHGSPRLQLPCSTALPDDRWRPRTLTPTTLGKFLPGSVVNYSADMQAPDQSLQMKWTGHRHGQTLANSENEVTSLQKHFASADGAPPDGFGWEGWWRSGGSVTVGIMCPWVGLLRRSVEVWVAVRRGARESGGAKVVVAEVSLDVREG